MAERKLRNADILSQVPAKNIPADYQRIVLLNPTRYLGNLLIAGGLIQDFYAHCRQHNIKFLLVVDAAYRELLQGFLPDEVLLFYPRKLINQGSFWQKVSAYTGCLSVIRRFKADIAFNIEEDSVSHRLTQLSGAKFKLGSNQQRNKHGYDHVMDINYRHRSDEQKHRWYGYGEVFGKLGFQSNNADYLKLAVGPATDTFKNKLATLGLDTETPFIIIHASAAKDYKKWPAEYFSQLIYLLDEANYPCVLIGAGVADQLANQKILSLLSERYPQVSCVDLCNLLSLSELAFLMTKAKAMVGNDSGPFHLGSALKLPGCVIFGPTDVELWRPLSPKSLVLKANENCAAECTKTGCIYDNRCLTAISPEQVSNTLLELL